MRKLYIMLAVLGIILSIILISYGLTIKPKLVNTIEKVTQVVYVSKTSYSGNNAVIIYTKNRAYIYENISPDENEINIGGTTYVYNYLDVYSFKSEKIK